jgi:SprT protein
VNARILVFKRINPNIPQVAMTKYREILLRFIPETTVPVISEWLMNTNVQLNISKNRNTKLGDYRPPQLVKYHKISVNHNLNKYHFLLTLVHEFAHLRTWEKHKNLVKPHGSEWKQEFRSLMLPFLNEPVFPADLLPVLKKYMKNPAASTSNVALLRALRKYDRQNDYLTLEEIPQNTVFSIDNGFVFRKLEKMRKRYKCMRLDNKRIYLVSPLIKVDVINKAV